MSEPMKIEVVPTEAPSPKLMVLAPDAHVFATPPGWERHDVGLEDTQPQPLRSKGTTTAQSTEGFVVAVGRHLGGFQLSACLYADLAARQLVAVMNDDVEGQAGWRDLRVALQLTRTPEWEDWLKGQGMKAQAEFADIIDRGQRDIVEPSPATMVELAETFSATVDAKFAQASRVGTGARSLGWDETVTARAGSKGDLVIPDSFVFAAVPFVGGREAIRTTARIRFKIREQKLAIGYTIERPHEVEQAAFELIVETTSKALGLPLVYGIPAAPR